MHSQEDALATMLITLYLLLEPGRRVGKDPTSYGHWHSGSPGAGVCVVGAIDDVVVGRQQWGAIHGTPDLCALACDE